MTEFKYRRDIDGLRAVAVLMVLIFHADLGLPGGYIGVDVFFVISGFLITRLILKDQENNEFVLSHFWIRRIRRIMPASTLVVLTTLIAGFFVLLPDDSVTLAWSSAAQQLLVSNVFLWRKNGYFAGNSDNLLLHTWSLAIEEQFYIGYPFLLMFLRRFARKFLILSLLILTAASFAASAWGVHTHPGATFYLLPTRAWELLFGGLLCFVPISTRITSLGAATIGAIGLSSIIVAACCYDSTTRFPGLAAVMPCAGTAMVIYANSVTTTFVDRVLSLKPLVYLGLISYSLYLWHWPLLSLLEHIYCGAQPNGGVRFAALVVSFVLAAISYQFVESPFRRKFIFADSRILIVAASASTATVIGLSLLILFFRGVPDRFDPKVIAFASAAQSKNEFDHNMTAKQIQESDVPTFGSTMGKYKCLIWGDSHAMVLVPGMNAACKDRGILGFQTTHTSTPPILEFVALYKYGLSELSPEFNRAALQFAVSTKVDLVILAGNWRMYDKNPAFERCLRQTVEELCRAGIRVGIVRDVATQNGKVPLILSMAVRLGEDLEKIGVSNLEYSKACEWQNAIFDRLKGENVRVLDPSPFLVDEAGLWRAEYGGQAMYKDAGHLTVDGSLRLKHMFEVAFDSFGLK